MSLPTDPKARKLVLDRVQKCVNLLNEEETLKEDRKNFAEEVQETCGLKKADFNKLVKTAYDQAKVEETVEELQTQLSEWDILRKLEES